MKVYFRDADYRTENAVLSALRRSIIPVSNPGTTVSGGTLRYMNVPFTVSRGIYTLSMEFSAEDSEKIQKMEEFTAVVPDPVMKDGARRIALAHDWLA